MNEELKRLLRKHKEFRYATMEICDEVVVACLWELEPIFDDGWYSQHDCNIMEPFYMFHLPVNESYDFSRCIVSREDL